jgi:signal transduction protein with GAF and PtsI domain
MSGQILDYVKLGRVIDAISSLAELDDFCEHIVHSITQALAIKGCALMLLDRATNELKIAASHGLSQEYLEKGPINAKKSIAESLTEGPAVIYDVDDDPRLQYPEEAKKEGIQSIVSLPLVLRGKPLGALRLYRSESWEVSIEDITVFQAIVLIIALTIDNIRIQKGLKASIDVLKVMHQATRPQKRTLYE